MAVARQAVWNGVDGLSGRYLLPKIAVPQLARLARGEAAERIPAFRAVAHGVDAFDLSSAGWGVIFAADLDPRVKRSLAPLLEHRRAQATRGGGGAYREYAHHPGETGREFLRRQRTGPGVADGRRVPYYLLIVGSPEAVPFDFQYQLDLQYAVGRLWFADACSYASYARSVIAAESGPRAPRARAALFAVRNADDRATHGTSEYLVAPLAARLAQDGRSFRTLAGREATKANLKLLLGGGDTPHLLFTASHGLGFPAGDPRQFAEQGALLCGDWPGPRAWHGAIPRDFYFAAGDVEPEARLAGLVTFHLACHSAGTPRWSPLGPRQESTLAPLAVHDFVAALPQRLLGHPLGGALAVVGHVDRAWGYSFLWEGIGSQPQTFISMLGRVLDGAPVGHAMDDFGERHTDIACELLDALEAGRSTDDPRLAALWTARHDARSYVLFGDPAVRLPIARVAFSTPTVAEPLRQRRMRGGSRPRPASEEPTSPAGATARYTNVSAPRRLPLRRRGEVAVRLTTAPVGRRASAVRLPAPGQPAVIEVHLHCDRRDFAILDRPVRELAVSPGRDTARVMFTIEGRRPGNHPLIVDFRQRGELAGTMRLSVEVVGAEAAEERQQEAPHQLCPEAVELPPPDLELRVTTEAEQGRTVVRYTLHSPNGAAPFHYQPAGGVTLQGSPQEYQIRLLRQLEAPASQREIAALGNRLYEELFAGPMRTAYRWFRERVATLQITSDEPWIPWELIKPFDYEVEPRIDDDFLCARFQLTRWIAGWGGPAGEIRLAAAACVEAAAPPGYDRLRYPADERRFLRGELLASNPGVRDLSPDPATRRAVEALLDRGGIGLWHFSGHGDADPASPNDAVILLSDGLSLTPDHVYGKRQLHIAEDRPLVFLNACRAGQRGWSLSRLGGWAGAWVDRARCGAFVGPQWSVEDRAACRFSCAFYEALRWGRTIGQAIQHAQQTARADDPEAGDWLAYTVYAHPNAHLVLPPDPESADPMPPQAPPIEHQPATG